MPRVSKTWRMALGLGKIAVSRYYIGLSVVTGNREQVLKALQLQTLNSRLFGIGWA